ncbi:MAG TPA: TetR/AcrR family transcriptional regulator [Firmicutes bacterium]|nr:TetR/AcrR family transcriptional regulator [Bacillota bacterium]
MYRKGQEKKEEIYNNAKRLLYEQGYEKTTIKQIAGATNAPVSLIHYYFKKKDDIIKCIYKDFLENIRRFLLKKTPHIFSDTILSHAVLSRIYYDIIFTDKNNRRVYYEVLRHKSNYEILHQPIVDIYRHYVEENQIKLPEELFQAYVLLDFGARRELFLNFLEGKLHLPVEDLVSTVNGLFPRLLKIKQEKIDRIMQDSITIFSALDYSAVKFLV